MTIKAKLVDSGKCIVKIPEDAECGDNFLKYVTDFVNTLVLDRYGYTLTRDISFSDFKDLKIKILTDRKPKWYRCFADEHGVLYNSNRPVGSISQINNCVSCAMNETFYDTYDDYDRYISIENFAFKFTINIERLMLNELLKKIHNYHVLANDSNFGRIAEKLSKVIIEELTIEERRPIDFTDVDTIILPNSIEVNGNVYTNMDDDFNKIWVVNRPMNKEVTIDLEKMYNGKFNSYRKDILFITNENFEKIKAKHGDVLEIYNRYGKKRLGKVYCPDVVKEELE